MYAFFIFSGSIHNYKWAGWLISSKNLIKINKFCHRIWRHHAFEILFQVLIRFVSKIFLYVNITKSCHYPYLSTALFNNPFAKSDCNALLILSFFILLVAVLYRPGKCFMPCLARDLTAGFFASFLTKLNRPRPRCLLLRPLRFRLSITSF